MSRYRYLWLMFLPLVAMSQPREEGYAVSLRAGYAYNTTYLHYGQFDVGTYLPVHRYVELQADARFTSANEHAVALQVRPKLPVKVGELYMDARALYTAYVRSSMQEWFAALGVGYRMDYVDLQLGLGLRTMFTSTSSSTSTSTFSSSSTSTFSSSSTSTFSSSSSSQPLYEPWCPLYRAEVYVRPNTSPWNISMAIANFTDYQVERLLQPIFQVGGWYRIDEHWRVQMHTLCKPSGMFHLCASFYGIELQFGTEYRF